MKLLIQRNQKSGFTGKSKYTLYVRAQLNDAEAEIVRRNRLENELLLYFDRDEYKAGFARNAKDEGGFWGMAMRMMRDVALTIGKLIEGTTFTCDNVGQLLSVEDETLIAAKNLKRYIKAAATFGGELAIDIDEMIRKEDEER
ncbi:MAG: hypothetical protein KDC32_05485 [Saprospiraceae bacterium]|nr:hypothetical protein [Saprospiraceae bacterium]